MKSRIWQLAGVGLLGLSISLGALAEGPGEGHGERGQQMQGEGGPGRSLNSRDEVRQTQPPRQGYYQDIPHRHGDDHHWQAGGPRPGGDWQGRRMAMAMAGGLGRSIARATPLIICPTVTGRCPTVARITSIPVATGTAHTVAVTS